MKRAFSILFLVIFLFNVGGYYLVFWGLRSQARKDLLHRLDADKYSAEELIVVAIPMALPYPNQESRFERVDGQFEYKGEFYNLVKQRIENDTLFIVCIKNRQEKELVNAMNEYSDLANNLPTGAKHTLDLFGKLFKDYNVPYVAITGHGGWSMRLTFETPVYSLQYQSYPVFSPPPNIQA